MRAREQILGSQQMKQKEQTAALCIIESKVHVDKVFRNYLWQQVLIDEEYGAIVEQLQDSAKPYEILDVVGPLVAPFPLTGPFSVPIWIVPTHVRCSCTIPIALVDELRLLASVGQSLDAGRSALTDSVLMVPVTTIHQMPHPDWQVLRQRVFWKVVTQTTG